ncbi:MAG: hypothetical protein WAU33_13135 [Candidatus Binataceae bacterium]
MKSARAALIAPLAVLACIAGAAILLARIYTLGSNRPPLRVRAVAHEWWWEFDYPSLDVRTSDVLYLPSGKEIELELDSADVIHSFWILGMKDPVDIIPGKPRQIDLTLKSPGDLYGNCDSGCGCGTVCMRFRVLARPPAEFQRWAADARSRRAEFKPPQTQSTPSCALSTGRDGHAGHDVPASHLQRLLDGSLSASRRSH